MQIYILCNGSLFQVFAHDPGQAPDAVTTVRFFAVKQPDVGVFGFQVLFQTDGHAVGQWHDAILFVLALADVNGPTFKIHIGDFQVDYFLTT